MQKMELKKKQIKDIKKESTNKVVERFTNTIIYNSQSIKKSKIVNLGYFGRIKISKT